MPACPVDHLHDTKASDPSARPDLLPCAEDFSQPHGEDGVVKGKDWSILVHLPHEPPNGTFQTEHACSRDWGCGQTVGTATL